VSIQAIVPFTFRDHEVRTVTLDGEPWFVAADVCRVLEIGNPTDALRDSTTTRGPSFQMTGRLRQSQRLCRSTRSTSRACTR
jgi:prophage antirepressor-like protein